MMAADVLLLEGQVYTFCQSHDHWKEEYTLAPPSSELIGALGHTG